MDAPEISAKQGINIQAVLDDIVDHVPAPKGDPSAPLQALVFDSQYDSYRGVIVLMRIVAGTLRRGMEATMMSTGASYKVLGRYGFRSNRSILVHKNLSIGITFHISQ